MRPPVPAQIPYVHHEHGVDRPDPFAWMREREDPRVIEYIEAENAFTAHRTDHLAGLRERLFDEMRGRIQETDTTAPVRRGEWWYYERTVEGQSYVIHCRKHGSLDAPEQVLLNENQLAESHDYTQVGAFSVSPDHRVLAYAVDHTGRELFDVYFVDLETGEVLDERIEATGGTLCWATDSRTLLYTELDDTLRPWRIRRHRLGEDGHPLVLQEDDPRFRLWVTRTRSDAYLVIGASSSQTSELRVLPADTPDASLHLVQPRHPGMRYAITHHGDHFYIWTDDCDDADGNHTLGAVNGKLMRASVRGTCRSEWVELIPHRDEVQIVRVEAFAGHLVLLEREGGLLHLTVRDLADDVAHRIEMPEQCYQVRFGRNPEFQTATLRFGYDSMVTPHTVIDYQMDTRARTVVKQTPVLGGYDADRYRTDRILATAADGTPIPISLVYSKHTPRDGSATLVLYGYGSYGVTIDASFVHSRISLMERGVVFAIAHVRGGGLMGRAWYEAGKFLHKRNTFTDFVACAEHLVAEQWTSPDRMAFWGGSAGGLLMGAVLNDRPDLCRCAVAAVPFVDVVSTMLDASLPLTANEWEEWGDPRKPEFFEYMLSYSPYDNVREDAHFPDLLITSGLNDPRVQYWEPTKWCARLRTVQGAGSEILLRTHMGAGHGGQSGRYGYLEDRAFDYAWLLDRLGLAD